LIWTPRSHADLELLNALIAGDDRDAAVAKMATYGDA
jgi:hypothetical protein